MVGTGSGWGMNGNSGTNPASNFQGNKARSASPFKIRDHPPKFASFAFHLLERGFTRMQRIYADTNGAFNLSFHLIEQSQNFI
jgi:hypothetical protein